MIKKAEVLKQASLKIAEQEAEIKKLIAENEALKKEVKVLAEDNEKKEEEISGVKKEGEARGFVKKLVEKGYVAPADADAKIASIMLQTNSIEDIKKMASLYEGFLNKAEDGDLVGERKMSIKSAESRFLAEINE